MKLISLLSFLILSLSTSLHAENLEQIFDDAINGQYKFKDVVCQNKFPKGSKEYDAFKLKTEHPGYKSLKNELTVADGVATHKTVTVIAGKVVCVVNGSGKITPTTLEQNDNTLLGYATLNIDVPKKYNKKTNLGCKCMAGKLNLSAFCELVVPFVKQTEHEVTYSINNNNNEKTISLTQILNYDDEEQTIESKDNFESKFRGYCKDKRDSDAPPTNIFTAIN